MTPFWFIPKFIKRLIPLRIRDEINYILFIRKMKHFWKCPQKTQKEAMIVVNGPSFLKNKEECLAYRKNVNCYTVNSAVEADWFYALKPEVHSIFDDEFFATDEHYYFKYNPHAREWRDDFWKLINENVDWNMSLYVPYNWYHVATERLTNTNITLCGMPYKELPNKKIPSYAAWSNGRYLTGVYNAAGRSLWLAIMARHEKIWLAGLDFSNVNIDNCDKECVLHFNIKYAFAGTSIQSNETCTLLYHFDFTTKNINSFARLKHAAENNNIQVVNLSLESLLDVFPKGELGMEPYAWKPNMPSYGRYEQ